MTKIDIWSTFRQTCLPPPRCVLCTHPATRHNLCTDCLAELPVLACACARCATPLAAPAERCGECLGDDPPWDSAQCAFHFAFPVDHLLRSVKFHGALPASLALGETAAVILAHAPHGRFDALVPIPLHWRRHWRRGFNQSVELAGPVAGRCQLDVAPELLTRTRPTREQTRLRAAERRANLAGAFRADPTVRGARLIVFDDVLTTGATAGAAATALKKAGAKEVAVWCCARAR